MVWHHFPMWTFMLCLPRKRLPRQVWCPASSSFLHSQFWRYIGAWGYIWIFMWLLCIRTQVFVLTWQTLILTEPPPQPKLKNLKNHWQVSGDSTIFYKTFLHFSFWSWQGLLAQTAQPQSILLTLITHLIYLYIFIFLLIFISSAKGEIKILIYKISVW